MPAVKIGFNLDSRKLISSIGAVLQSFSIKRGSVVDFELSITQNELPVNLPNLSSVEFGAKLPAADPGTYVFHTTAERTGWGSGTRWFFRVDLNTGDYTDVLGKPLDSEILIQMPDGQRIASLNAVFTILKNVIP